MDSVSDGFLSERVLELLLRRGLVRVERGVLTLGRSGGTFTLERAVRVLDRCAEGPTRCGLCERTVPFRDALRRGAVVEEGRVTQHGRAHRAELGYLAHRAGWTGEATRVAPPERGPGRGEELAAPTREERAAAAARAWIRTIRPTATPRELERELAARIAQVIEAAVEEAVREASERRRGSS